MQIVIRPTILTRGILISYAKWMLTLCVFDQMDGTSISAKHFARVLFLKAFGTHKVLVVRNH